MLVLLVVAPAALLLSAFVRRFAGDADVLTDHDASVDQLLTAYAPPRT